MHAVEVDRRRGGRFAEKEIKPGEEGWGTHHRAELAVRLRDVLPASGNVIGDPAHPPPHDLAVAPPGLHLPSSFLELSRSLPPCCRGEHRGGSEGLNRARGGGGSSGISSPQGGGNISARRYFSWGPRNGRPSENDGGARRPGKWLCSPRVKGKRGKGKNLVCVALLLGNR